MGFRKVELQLRVIKSKEGTANFSNYVQIEVLEKILRSIQNNF